MKPAHPTVVDYDEKLGAQTVSSLESAMYKHVLLYGLLCGVLIAALRLIGYRWLVVEYSVEIYGALVAAVFAALGIWLGLRLTRRTETVVVREVPVPAPAAFVRDESRLSALGITSTVRLGCARRFAIACSRRASGCGHCWC